MHNLPLLMQFYGGILMPCAERDEILLVRPKLNPESDNTPPHCTYNSRRTLSTSSASLSIINEPTADYPLNLLYLAAYLCSRGHKVRIVDTEKLSKSYSFRQIRSSLTSAAVVGITVTTPALPHALELSDFIKSIAPTLPIVWGGIHPTLYPYETIKDDAIDFVNIGEGEIPLDLLVTCLTQEDWVGIQRIPNLLFKGEKIISNHAPIYNLLPTEKRSLATPKIGRSALDARCIHYDFNAELLPAYHLLDLEKYVRVRQADGTVRRTIEILTSRGCPYRCTFCVNSILNPGKWRALPVEKVLRDIRTLVNEYSIEHIFFMDENFFIRLDRVMKIIHGLEEFNITWEANIRADFLREGHIPDDLLKIFRQTGCRLLRIGAESGSQKILNILQKGITPMDILNAVRRCSRFGILCNLSFMIAIPGETKQDMKKTVDLIHKIRQVEPRTEIIGPQPFRPYPGSVLYNVLDAQGLVEKPDNPRALCKSSLLLNMLYLNVVTGKFDSATVEYLRDLGYIVETDPDKLQKEVLRKGDRRGRRFQK